MWNFQVTGVPQAKKPGEKVTEGIEVALNPEELDLDTAAMQAKYDQTLREQQSQLEKEDLSDMVAEHAAKQKVHFKNKLHIFNCIICPIYISASCKIYVRLNTIKSVKEDIPMSDTCFLVEIHNENR